MNHKIHKGEIYLSSLFFFDIKTGPVVVYLGNRICVDSDRYNVLINQTAYIDELLGKLDSNDPDLQIESNKEILFIRVLWFSLK